MSQPSDAGAFGCVGATIRLYQGGYFDLAHPRPEAVTLRDVARGLSHLCRFGGQVRRFYSVAEHSFWCAAVARRDGRSVEVQRACLLHDAAEAYVGDVVKPLKRMLAGYAAIETAVQGAIATRWGIDFGAHHAVIEEVDRAMLIAERLALFSADGVPWTGEESVRRLEVVPECWSPERAMVAFLSQAALLGLQP